MFALTILVSPERLDAIKAELIHKLPDVKSSHRCEAIARGLGFLTYASALVAVKVDAPKIALVQGDLFASYLVERGFDCSPKVIYHAAAKVALGDVSKRTPRLTMWGIGVGRPRRGEMAEWRDSAK